MRPIDADKTIGLLKTRLYETAGNNLTVVCHASYLYKECADNRIEAWIDEAPTIDAVQVIRCKHCIYNKRNTDAVAEDWCYHFGYDVEEEDFCSYGERN